VRASVDAIGVGSETILIDDPLLTAREVYRERPLARVIFDRRLRTPPTAKVLSTLAAGPVIILTAPEAEQADDGSVRALREQGATVLAASGARLEDALRQLPALGIQSLLIEGGARLHAAVWDEGLADYVQLYVTPPWLGDDGLPLLPGRNFSSTLLHERRVRQIGPDVLIEGYVHRPH
jgi:diaminohydroxyphosphoribosylaminopyrimidine deaminase/5-amino-6-(5-phosphoribosylamino)uracil reductase